MRGQGWTTLSALLSFFFVLQPFQEYSAASELSLHYIHIQSTLNILTSIISNNRYLEEKNRSLF